LPVPSIADTRPGRRPQRRSSGFAKQETLSPRIAPCLGGLDRGLVATGRQQCGGGQRPDVVALVPEVARADNKAGILSRYFELDRGVGRRVIEQLGADVEAIQKCCSSDLDIPGWRGCLLERFEGATDLLVVGIIIALGLAMLIGLLTADGKVSWN
jgi:hypothetical protein